ncbi:MAG: transporter [Paludibacteraceae bacterium]|nr:transporter [Paludibacteraceae bacterium]
MNKLIQFFRDWTLPISMLVGASAYMIWHQFDLSVETHKIARTIVSIAQPLMIFMMLFISFCKVDPKDFRLIKWHQKGLLIQVLSFVVGALVLILFPVVKENCCAVVEAAMICMICPTATAAAVVTQKLNGNATTLVSYTTLINIANAVVVSAFVPLIHPESGVSFSIAFFKIMAKVFPMLICPLFLAAAVRYFFPKFHSLMLKSKDLAFYIWVVSLALAIAVTAKGFVHSDVSVWVMVGIAVVSLISCIVQFVVGKVIGRSDDDTISGGQALGQKNTVFAIWMGDTFFTPITSLAGGFYSLWHNAFNSWQLYQVRHKGKL